MSLGKIKPSVKSPKRIRPSIKKEAVSPALYNRLKLPWSCDDCAHFDRNNEVCTLGLNANNHRKLQQEIDYVTGGHFAVCRFQEID